MPPSRLKFHVIAFAAFALVCADVGASPPPTDAFDTANAALTAAATPDGERYAADELAATHRQLDAAQAAMAKRDYKNARVLAEEAQADAELARAKSRAQAARAAIEAKTQDNAELRHRLLDQEPLDQPPPQSGLVPQQPVQLQAPGQPAPQEPMQPGPMQPDPSQLQEDPIQLQQEPVQ